VRRLYGDIATYDAIEEAIELLVAFSRTIASTAGEGPMFRQANPQGYLHGVLLFDMQMPRPQRSRASLDLIDHIVHSENIPGVPFGGIARRRGASIVKLSGLKWEPMRFSLRSAANAAWWRSSRC